MAYSQLFVLFIFLICVSDPGIAAQPVTGNSSNPQVRSTITCIYCYATLFTITISQRATTNTDLYYIRMGLMPGAIRVIEFLFDRMILFLINPFQSTEIT
jgi:hypothetical protein